MQHVQCHFDNAMSLESPEFQRLCDAARQCRIWLTIGNRERPGSSLYTGQALIADTGKTLFTHRNLRPTQVVRSVFGDGDGDGSDLTVMPSSTGNVGTLNCWGHLQPISKHAIDMQNEQIHVAAWPSFSVFRGGAHALGAEVNNAASRIYAVNGGSFVIGLPLSAGLVLA